MRKFRNRISSLFTRIKRFFRHPIETTTVAFKAVVEWVKDPDLTVITAGLLGSFIGRSFLYLGLGWSSAILGLWVEVAVIGALVCVDALIHFQTVQAMRRLMAFDVMTHMLRVVPSFQPV